MISPFVAPAALLLDLDGTIVDSRRDIALACNAARAAHGLEPLDEDVIAAMVGDGARALVARAFGIEQNDPLLEPALRSFHESYVACPCVHSTLLRGARELLEHAAATNLPCAVVTNKPREVAVLLLARLGVAGLLRGLWAGGDGPLKPSPAGIIFIAERLKVDPRLVWMIGDGPQDVGAGRSAGCVTIGVPGIAERDHLVASGPSFVCASLVEVRDLVIAAQA